MLQPRAQISAGHNASGVPFVFQFIHPHCETGESSSLSGLITGLDVLYFPMQKSLKMISRISSGPTRPVILPRLVRAKRTPSAARARSKSLYCRY